MTKDLEIVDDAGDEFYATNIPIPFYIRLKLENEKTKYRAKILDEAGNTRSFYTGVTKRNFLELHVPVIPLREKGKIIVEIEVSDINSNEATKHQATIDYVSQEEYEAIKKTEMHDEVETGELGSSQIPQYEKIDETPEDSPELTTDELAYLTQRTDSFEPREETNEVEDDIKTKNSDTESFIPLEKLPEETEVSAELSIDEIAYLTQRSEILSKSEIKEKDTKQIFSQISEEE